MEFRTTREAVDSNRISSGLPVGTNGLTGGSSGQLVGGHDAPRWLTIEGRTMPAAPDWSRGGYTTIFDQ
jgi:hypothetical protein